MVINSGFRWFQFFIEDYSAFSKLQPQVAVPPLETQPTPPNFQPTAVSDLMNLRETSFLYPGKKQPKMSNKETELLKFSISALLGPQVSEQYDSVASTVPVGFHLDAKDSADTILQPFSETINEDEDQLMELPTSSERCDSSELAESGETDYSTHSDLFQEKRSSLEALCEVCALEEAFIEEAKQAAELHTPRINSCQIEDSDSLSTHQTLGITADNDVGGNDRDSPKQAIEMVVRKLPTAEKTSDNLVETGKISVVSCSANEKTERIGSPSLQNDVDIVMEETADKRTKNLKREHESGSDSLLELKKERIGSPGNSFVKKLTPKKSQRPVLRIPTAGGRIVNLLLLSNCE